MALTDKLAAIADAIRDKTGKTELLTINAMPDEIKSIDNGLNTTIVEFSQLNSQASSYLNASTLYTDTDRSITVITNYKSTNYYDDPVGKSITISSNGIMYMQDESTGKGFINTVSAGSRKIYNLIPGHIYQWYVKNSSGKITDSGRLKSKNALRMLYFAGPHNMRDLGGWACDGGTIKYGLLVRGGAFGDNPSKEDIKLANDIGIKWQIDLRQEGETTLTSSPIGNEVHYENIQLNGYYYDIINPSGSIYYNVILVLRKIMDAVVHGECVYYHCSLGADRTGTISYMLEALLGMSRADMDKDYELTTFYIYPFQSNTRTRTRSDYNAMISYLESLNGNTFVDKVVQWYLDAGFSIKELNAFRKAVIDGTPSILSANLIPSAQAIDSINPYNGIGYKNGTYLSSVNPFEGSDSSTVLTGYIKYPVKDIGLPPVIYIKGAEWQNISHCRLYFFSEDKSITQGIMITGVGTDASTDLTQNFEVKTLGDKYITLTPIADTSGNWVALTTSFYQKNARWFRISLVGRGENLVITLDEPIE